MKPLPLLALMLAAAINAAAVTYEGSCGKNLRWTLKTSDYTLTISGSGAMDDYSYVNGVSSAPWCKYGQYIHTVMVLEGATYIGSRAFAYCEKITAAYIPTSVTAMGFGTFRSCTKLERVVLNSSITQLPDMCFAYCTFLNYVFLPSTLQTIGEYAFFRCPNLKSIELPNSLTTIGKRAFFTCEGLTTVTGLKSVESMDTACFCATALTKIDISGPLTSLPPSAFANCQSLTSVSLPNTVTAIGEKAFSGCNSLTNIAGFDGVQTIGVSAFSETAIWEINLPNITKIDGSAFADCTRLSSITCGGNLNWVGRAAFSNCALTDDNSLISFAAITPPNAGGTAEEMFGPDNAGYLSSRVVLRVPTRSVSDYKQHAVWGAVIILGGYSDGLRSLRAGRDFRQEGNTLTFDRPTAYTLHTADGRLITHGTTTTLTLPAHGLYLLQSGTASARVVY